VFLRVFAPGSDIQERSKRGCESVCGEETDKISRFTAKMMTGTPGANAHWPQRVANAQAQLHRFQGLSLQTLSAKKNLFEESISLLNPFVVKRCCVIQYVVQSKMLCNHKMLCNEKDVV